MNDTVLIAIIGVLGALGGSVIGAVVTYFVQRKLLDSETKRTAHLRLLEKRIAALQQINLALDFAFGNTGKTEGGPVGELFVKIVHEMPLHIAFLPREMRTDARNLMFQFFSAARTGTANFDGDALTALRDNVQKAIDESYEQYSNGS